MTKATLRASVWASFLAVFLFAAFAPAAASAAGKRRVGVDVNGSPAGPIRAAISAVLKHHGYQVSSADLSGDSQDAIASAAKKGKLGAVIVGEVRDGGKRAKLRAYAADGDLIGEGSWTEHGGAKKLAAAIKRTLWARIGGALAKAKAGGAEASERPAKAVSEPQAEKADKGAEKADKGAEKADKAAEKAEEPDEKSSYSRSEETEKTADADESSARRAKSKASKKKAAADAEAEEESEGESAGGGVPAATALDLGVGGRFLSRTLTWANNAVRGYNMNGVAPAVGLTLAWYPAAHVRGGWVSNIGLAASAEYLVGYQSKTGDGTHYPTQENDYWGGLRGRMFLGPVEGALTLGGGQHAFVFRSGGTANRAALADLPDVQYTYARAALDFRIALPANVSLVLGGGYRDVLGGGKTNYLVEGPSFFPGAKISGLDVTGGVGYRVFPFLEGRAGVDLRRYQITTNASGMQPAVASGTDQTFAIWVQAVLIIDGVKGGAGAGTAVGRPAPSPDDDKGENAEKPASKSEAKSRHKDDDE